MKYYYFYSIVCENEAGPNPVVRTARVPIEVELTPKHPVVVIAASIEPRVRRVNEVGIVTGTKTKNQRDKELISTIYNLHLYRINLWR